MNDNQTLQKDLDILVNCVIDCRMNFNFKICLLMRFKKNNNKGKSFQIDFS